MIATLIASTLFGLQVGDSVSPFEPYHVTGPYAETNQCPVCEWGGLPIIFIWTNSTESAENLKLLTSTVNAAMKTLQKPAKALLIDANLNSKDADSINSLKAWAKDWQTDRVYFLSRPSKLKTPLQDYKLGGETKWKSVVYIAKNRKVISAFIDPIEKDIPAISDAISSIEKW